MKNWNGWEIDTLKKHGWSTIRIIKEGSDSDWTDMKDWLSQCCWGRSPRQPVPPQSVCVCVCVRACACSCVCVCVCA